MGVYQYRAAAAVDVLSVIKVQDLVLQDVADPCPADVPNSDGVVANACFIKPLDGFRDFS